LRLLDNHFPKEHPLHHLINRNTVKVSYRCLPNLGKVISKHNSKVMKQSLQTEENPQPAQNLENLQSQNCNCRNKEGCPLMGHCQERGVIYQATVLTEGERNQTYIGLTAGTFKKRFDGHTSTFRNETLKGTTLSSYIWKLKNEGKNSEILWKVISKATPFSPVTEQCALCTAENFYIIYKPELGSLNTRNELGAHCRHKQRVLLDKT
jgi:hypothetical protein